MRTLLILSVLFIISACLAKPNYHGDENVHHNHQHRHHRHHHHNQRSQDAIELSPWAQTHMDDVTRMADRMRQEFNAQAYGRKSDGISSSPQYSSSGSSSVGIPNFTGKTQEELDQLAKQISEQMINDMKTGRLSYSQITKPNWFEQQAALKLEALDHTNDNMLQQRTQNVFEFEPQVRQDNLVTELENLNRFDEISHVTYPPNVAVIGGKRYVTRKNCTTVTSTNGEANPPSYSGSYIDSRNAHQERVSNYPAQVVIPVEDSEYERDSRSSDFQQRTYYPEFNFTDNNNFKSFGVGNQVFVQTPSHQAKITINQMNRTFTNRPGYQYPIVTGCRGTTVIVNGNVVYNHSQPIGTGGVMCSQSTYSEAEWKRKEREHLFWLLSQRSLTSEEELRRWQEQNWQQLTELAQEYKTTVEEIKEFQRSELRYYFDILSRHGVTSEYYDDWMRKEKSRWDWLIQQNRITQEELARWQQENRERLDNLAHLYRISIEELQNWQRNELQRFQNLFAEQNTKISKLTEWQTDVRNRLNTLMLQHNTTVEQLRENIRQDLWRLQNMSQLYHIDIEEFKRWLENEQQRISRIIEQRSTMVVENWQREERQRIEQVIRQFNLSTEELRERLEMEHNHIRNLANQYHINVEKIKEWQMQEIARLQSEGRLQQARLEAWQQQLQNQLKSMIRQHEITITELEEVIKRDHQRLEQLAQQYQISLRQIENWYRNEAERLVNVLRVENLERDWKWRERQRIDEFLRHHEYTVEELRQRLFQDRSFLENMAQSYQLQIQELENWYESEIRRLQDLGLVHMRAESLIDWQREEDRRIQALLQHRNFTFEDLEYRLKHDYEHLLQLSRQYSINQQQILDWYNHEVDYLLQNNYLKRAESLTDWQIKENQYINEIIKNHTFSMEDLTRRLEYDRQHLETLTKQYNIQMSEILNWYRKQAESLVNRGIIQEMEMLQEWQTKQRQYVYDLIRTHEMTINELEQRLLHDQNYLNSLSKEFNISIQELQEWYQKEIRRLIDQGFIQKSETIRTWQTIETERIMNLIKQQNLNYEELERILLLNREQLYTLAQKYEVNIQELENWYRTNLLRLREEGIVSELTQWQITVRNRLEELIKEYRWSIEELKERFQKNEDHLYDLIHQYNITMERLIEWYNKELNRLYEKDLIYSSNLWQEQERAHLRNLAIQYQHSLQKIQETLLRNEVALKEIADKYHIAVKQLIDWYHKLINEFLSTGLLINDLVSAEADYKWKEKERERLMFIVKYTRMSYSEMVDFLRDDNNYNQILADGYKINLYTLTDFQQNELRQWVNEGHLNKLDLIVLEEWQKKERDHLYELIKQYGITVDKLPMWQETNREILEQRSSQYGIAVQTLIDWQRKELQRLYELAVYYHMTLGELEQFRADELLRIANAAHKPTLYNEFQNWEYKEHWRLENMRRQKNFSDEELWVWRRRLFLYCQGLRHLKQCTYGTRTGKIDLDRGDQPPQMGPNECDEESEPGLAEQTYTPPAPRPTKAQYIAPLAPYPVQTSIYKYEKNRTEKVVIGPNAHTSQYENTREFREESAKPILGSSSWSSVSTNSYDSSRSHQGGYRSGSTNFDSNISSSVLNSNRFDNQRQYPFFGTNYTIHRPLIDNNYTKLNMPGVALHSDEQNEFQADQQRTEDLTQEFEDLQQKTQNLGDEFERLDQQRVQSPSQSEIEKLIQKQSSLPNTRSNSFNDKYKSESRDFDQQTVQKVQHPSAKELEDLSQRQRSSARNLGYNSSPSIHSSSKEYPAKVEEINPELEVEAVQVTQKPGLWKRIFG